MNFGTTDQIIMYSVTIWNDYVTSPAVWGLSVGQAAPKLVSI